MKTTRFLALAVALMVCILPHTASAAAPGGHIYIRNVFVDLPPGSITIEGDLLTFGGSPTVTLGSFGVLTLSLVTPQRIVAACPVAACDMTAGDYRLVVSTGSGQSKHDEYDLTIGAVGIQGPPGDKGPAGDRGLPGDTGPVGDKGPPGDKGPTGDKGLPGDKGPEGDKGMPGDKGPTGDKGTAGDRGPVGPPGPAAVNDGGSTFPLVITADSTITTGGEILVTHFDVAAGVTLTIQGPTIIRATGFVRISGTVAMDPVVPGGSVTAGGPFGAFLDAGGNGNGLGGGYGGTNSDAAGGGGGNGGRGGAGQYSGGGTAYAHRLQPYGSGGGAGQNTSSRGAGAGGAGGSALFIVASGAIDMRNATLRADGGDGGAASNGGGGGSGGTIGIFSETSIDMGGARFFARGGNGVSRGGGGGGGQIIVVSPVVTGGATAGMSFTGGAGFQPGEGGRNIVRLAAPGPWAP